MRSIRSLLKCIKKFSIFRLMRFKVSSCVVSIFLFLCSGMACAEEKLEGFDYILGKIDGHATVTGRFANFEFQGDVAEALYYQLGGANNPEIIGNPKGIKTRERQRIQPGWIEQKPAWGTESICAMYHPKNTDH